MTRNEAARKLAEAVRVACADSFNTILPGTINPDQGYPIKAFNRAQAAAVESALSAYDLAETGAKS